VRLAGGLSGRLIHKSEKPRPERRRSAGASDDLGLAIHHDVVAGVRIRVGGDVRNAAPRLSRRPRGWRRESRRGPSRH